MHHTPEDRNKALARAYIEEAINKRDMSAMQKYMSPDYVEHQIPQGMAATPDAMQKGMELMMQGFPDLRYEIKDQIAEGDKTVMRVMAYGTHQGEFMGVPATNKRVQWEEIHISRWADGMLVEHWGVADMAGLMQQLGAMPGAEMAA